MNKTSDMMLVLCVGCGRSVTCKRSGSFGDILTATGFKGFADVGNGLEMRYVCPTCVAEMKPHLEVVHRLVGRNRYAHWSNLLKMCDIASVND